MEYGFTRRKDLPIFWMECDTFVDFFDHVFNTIYFEGWQIDFYTTEKDSNLMSGWRIDEGIVFRFADIDFVRPED